MFARACLAACGVAAAVCAAFATPANAGLITGGSCPGASQAFAQFGDPRYYVFGANGGLELGSYGWSLSGGATVVAGNESFFLHSRDDDSSLYLPKGASATTPPTCMETSSTVVRFFVKRDSNLRVQVVERNLLGAIVGILDVTTVDGTSTWQPSPAVLNLQSLQGLLGVATVQLRFTALDGPSQVDDVFVDPWGNSD